MWANTLSRKQLLSAPQIKAPACKGKESSVTEQKVSIPDSWELSDNQRRFIESFMDPKAK
ncbi:hypothetical protein [Pantoea sp. KPR_PJ]|uniref:hypothetical protein n=1 Tax=Pantoea sp. KPR_PJ TaxID=2738375 RepID=UPI003526C77A